MSKQVLQLLAILIVLSFSQTVSSTMSDSLYIYRVTNISDFNQNDISGGLMGGTKIRIWGYGFDAVPENNIVTIGQSPCVVTEVGHNMLVCRTGPSSQLYRPTVSISAPTKQKYSCTTCFFSYNYTRTPTLNKVYPRSGLIESRTFFMGSYLYTPLTQLTSESYSIMVGDTTCLLDNIIQSTTNLLPLSRVLCDIKNEEAGSYNVYSTAVNGILRRSPSVSLPSIVTPGTSFDYVVFPTVTGVSVHEGFHTGNKLTITGTAFPMDSSKVEVEVGGIPCVVSSSTVKEIKCAYAAVTLPNDFGKQVAGGAQTKPYFQGSGFTHDVYSFTDLPASAVDATYFVDYVRTNDAKVTKITATNFSARAIIGELEVSNADFNDLKLIDSTKMHGTVSKGYFVAPIAATYNFQLTATKNTSVYMSSFKGSAEVVYTTPSIKFAAPKAYTKNQAEVERIRQVSDATMQASVTLTLGQAVYFEIYCASNTVSDENTNAWSLNVDFPNTDLTFKSSVQEIQKIEVSSTFDGQNIVFEQFGATSGNFEYSEGAAEANKKSVPYNANSAQFRDILKSYDHIEKFFVSLTVEILDSTGGLTSVTGNPAFKYRYTVNLNGTFDAARPINVKKGDAVNSNPAITPQGTFTVGPATTLSPSVSGTFGLSYSGQVLKSDVNQADPFAFDTATSPETLERIMYNQFGLNVKVTTYVDNFNRTLLVEFFGLKADAPAFVVVSAKLAGGKAGLVPTATVTTIRQFSATNSRFEPVTFEFLRVPAAKSSVIVKVNKVISQCKGDCSYVFAAQGSVPSISANTLTNNIISFTLSAATDPPTEVTLADQNCGSIALGAAPTYTCTLQAMTGAPTKPLLEAGDHALKVYVGTKGYATPAVALPVIAVPVTITAVTGVNPDTANTNGGTMITLTGEGFPYNAKRTFTLTQCAKPVHIDSITENTIKFLSADCVAGASTVDIDVGGKTSSIAFTYTAAPGTVHTVTSFTPLATSPILKGDLEITGTNFGSVMSDLKVYLTQSGKHIYELKIFELDSVNNKIKARIPIGVAGTYKVKVFKNGVGYATDGVDFKFEDEITSFLPAAGSKFGGTVLTITGKGFSTVLSDNVVFIDAAENLKCEVISATATTITCRTSAINPTYGTTAYKVVVLVKGKRLVSVTNFDYSIVAAPTLAANQNDYRRYAGDSVKYTGTNLVNVNPTTVTVGGKAATLVTAATNTEINFVLPNLYYGRYPVNILVDGIGYPSSDTYVNVLFRLDSSSGTFSAEGNALIIAGSGFLPINDANLRVSSNNTNVQFKVTSVSETELKMDVGKCNSGDTIQFTIEVVNITQTYNYLCSQTKTPVVVSRQIATAGYTGGAQPIRFNQTAAGVTGLPTGLWAYLVDTNGNKFGSDILISTTPPSPGPDFTIDGTNLAAGKYRFKFLYANIGYAKSDSTLEITATPAPTSPALEAGYLGGPDIIISGTGLNTQSKLILGGKVEAQIDLGRSTASTLYYTVPAYANFLTQTSYGLFTQAKLTGDIIADNLLIAETAFDNKISTAYPLGTVASSFIGYDFGTIKRANITKIRYFVNQTDSLKISDVQVRGSNNNVDWTVIGTTKNDNSLGWNVFKTQLTASFDLAAYRYVAIRAVDSAIRITELEFYGYFVSDVLTALALNNVGADFSDGVHTIVNITQVAYKETSTPTITAISARYGTPLGQQSITITGTNFGTLNADVKVTIDGITCAIVSTIATQIVCTTGARPNAPSTNTFVVTVKSNRAFLKTDPFLYAYKWSQDGAWNINYAPVDGDTVTVPKGTTLVFDQSTTKLSKIVVEGTLIIDSALAINVQAGSIIVNGGSLIAGTEAKPYATALTFTFSGAKVTTENPQFGNKGIGCYNCILDINGKKRDATWTELAISAVVGATTITVTTTVDWAAGDKIVISSSSFELTESEERIIASVDTPNKIITLTTPLSFLHKVSNQAPFAPNVNLRPEVALISRNIKIEEEVTYSNLKFGPNLMISGEGEKGLISRVSFTEFSNCGQQSTLKSCINFDKNGDLTTSFLKGNAVRSSYARVAYLKETSFLTVDGNVGYSTPGNSITLATGTEKNNVISNNLIVSALKTSTLEASEVFPSGFYITNPINTLKNNRVAGSDGYGFNYQFGLATVQSNIQHLQVQSADTNVAHAIAKEGLRIVQANFGKKVGTAFLKSTFSNFILWNIKENGVFTRESENLIFLSFVVMNFRLLGVAVERASLNCEYSIALTNWIIALEVGSVLKPTSACRLTGTPKSLTNITFANLPVETTVLTIPSYSSTKISVLDLDQITTTNVTGPFIDTSPESPITFKVKGNSLSTEFNGVSQSDYTIVNAAPYNKLNTKCTLPTNLTRWSNLTACASDVQPVLVMTTSTQAQSKITPITDYFEILNATHEISTLQTNPIVGSATNKFSQATLLGGQTYSIWNPNANGLESFRIETGCVSPPTGDAILLRYNFSSNYNTVTALVDGVTKTPSFRQLDKTTCKYGDIYLTSRYLYVCIRADGWKPELPIIIQPSACVGNCDFPIDFNSTDDIVCPNNVTFVNWSNSSIWRRERPPFAGESVTIPFNCRVVMDVDVENLNNLIIEGTLTIKDENRVLSAKFIWVKGLLQAGAQLQPFQSNLMIRLLGARTDSVYTIDSTIAWSKSMVVTGRLELYGKTPVTPETKLTTVAAIGDTTINVASTAGWVVGNTIGISPSLGKFFEYEKRTITALTATTVTFTPGLRFLHFGAATPLTNVRGEIDTRCVVGLIDRNIKIASDVDAEDWSYSVLIYGWSSTSFIYSSSAVISAVQFTSGGQFNTERAALNVINTALGTANTLVVNSTFAECLNYCVYLKNIKFTSLLNNFFFEGQRYLVYTEGAESFYFRNNTLIGARNRTKAPTGNTESIAAFVLTTQGTNVSVKSNTAHGSQGTGFILPFVGCTDLKANGNYEKNIAGTAKIGFVFSDAGVTSDCKAAGFLAAYACEIGVTANPTATSVVWDNLQLADNGRALGLRFNAKTENSNNNSLFLTNSWISAVSRTTCPDCYEDGKIPCSNLNALRLLVVTAKPSSALDDTVQQVTTPEEIDANAWMINVTFDNFRLSYANLAPSALATKCSNNRLFEVHPQADSSIGNHHFINTTVTDSDSNAFGFFTAPNAAYATNAGGCGTTVCTGRNNYLIRDHNGTFLGAAGTLVPGSNNKMIESLSGCTFNATTNGYFCPRDDIGRLKFRNIANDFQSRVMWPVTVTKETTTNTIEINGWREYQFAAGVPLNKRMGRFLSLIQYGQCYNVSFTAQPPTDMLFSFSLPTLAGDNSKFACIKIYHPVASSVAVAHANGTDAVSIPANDAQEVTGNVTTCGINKYLFKDNIIHFIVTADPECVVRVTLRSSVQVTIRLNVDMATFTANDGNDKFLTLLANYLNISKSRLTINGVTAGSTVFTFTINSELPTVENSATGNPASAANIADLKNLANKITSANSSSIPNLLNVNANSNFNDANGNPVIPPSDAAPESMTKYIIIGCVLGAAVLAGVAIGAYFLVKKLRARPSTSIEEQSGHNINGGEEQSVNLEKEQGLQRSSIRPIVKQENEEVQNIQFNP